MWLKKQLIAGIIALAVALLAGGTSPWWWSKLFPPAQTRPPETTDATKLGPSTEVSPAEDGSPKARHPPDKLLQKIRSKLVITGSNNEIYFYWDANVAVRIREPFTVTTSNEHSHVALPDRIPVDIEFAGHDNTLWCRDGSMVGTVVGNGLNGNKFEVRTSDEPPPDQATPAQKSGETFNMEEDDSVTSADGRLRISLFKIFANHGGAAFTFIINGHKDSHVYDIPIGNHLDVPGRGVTYSIYVRGVSHGKADVQIRSRTD